MPSVDRICETIYLGIGVLVAAGMLLYLFR